MVRRSLGRDLNLGLFEDEAVGTAHLTATFVLSLKYRSSSVLRYDQVLLSDFNARHPRWHTITRVYIFFLILQSDPTLRFKYTFLATSFGS